MEYLTIIALGANQIDVVRIFWELIAKYDICILRYKSAALENDFGFITVVGGNGSAVAKLEEALQNLDPEKGFNLLLKRSSAKVTKTDVLPYRIQIIGTDESEVVHEICYFLTSFNIVIENFDIEAGIARGTDTLIFTLNMIIHIPVDFSISNLREQFHALCDELNVDGILESDLCL